MLSIATHRLQQCATALRINGAQTTRLLSTVHEHWTPPSRTVRVSGLPQYYDPYDVSDGDGLGSLIERVERVRPIQTQKRHHQIEPDVLLHFYSWAHAFQRLAKPLTLLGRQCRMKLEPSGDEIGADAVARMLFSGRTLALQLSSLCRLSADELHKRLSAFGPVGKVEIVSPKESLRIAPDQGELVLVTFMREEDAFSVGLFRGHVSEAWSECLLAVSHSHREWTQGFGSW